MKTDPATPVTPEAEPLNLDAAWLRSWRPSMLTDEQLAELRRLEAAATPGPWRSRKGYGSLAKGYRYVQFGPTEAKAAGLGTDLLSPGDSDFIAAIRNAAPELLAALSAAEERISELEAAVRTFLKVLDQPDTAARRRNLVYQEAGLRSALGDK